MGGTKWIYLKEQSHAINYLIFFEILFQVKNLLQRVDLMHQLPKLYLAMFFSSEYP